MKKADNNIACRKLYHEGKIMIMCICYIYIRKDTLKNTQRNIEQSISIITSGQWDLG